MQKPQPGTYPAYYEKYLESIEAGDILFALEEQIGITRNFLTAISVE